MIDESHQHAILTPAQIGELVVEARAIRKAIDTDAENPAAVGFLEAARYGTTTSPFKALQKAYLELGKRLDVYALALLQVSANGTRIA